MARILIVEDNADLLTILRELLGARHEVATARRGEDAIEMARAVPPDLVIMDVNLPNMDGIEAGLWIKRDRAPEHIAILVLTAMAGPAEMEAIIASGCCDAYMSKPASLKKILSRVEELLPAQQPQATT
jgi:CheY-like chemotaxis protein